MVRLVNNKPMPVTRKGTEDMRISVCTDCRYGIFKNGDPALWTKRGLVHQRCEDKRLVNEAQGP